ncbi:OCIA domain-containing protein 1 [Colossoma macropomum]|uniref:OCIA domain-containing protein 1 n=1 Tax=Colossoma macropomum TaxID=42526 RepID=UPI0018644555|nr:OCIA domain-containing protein 1 [Colossoma macropomum]
MSQASSGFNPTPQQTHRNTQGPLGAAYIPTEDEKRVFRECNRESFYYRSLPLSAIAIAVTQVMVSRGVLSPSPRFGSLPKVAIAGLFGYMGGKVSYMKICQEKFKNLENSPLGEALRQGRLRHVPPELNQSEFADPNPAAPQQSGFETAFQANSQPNPYSSYSSDYPYSSPSSSYDPAPFSSGLSEPAPYSSRDDVAPQAPPYQEDDAPKKRTVLYEELRSKNRENYEVTLTQKAETHLKPQAEVPTPKNEVKKNKYGDAWDE